MKNWIGAVAMLLLVTGCGSEAGVATTSVPSLGASTATPTPTAIPTPASVTFSGQGSKVTDPFVLARGNYRVTWQAPGPAEPGNRSFVVQIGRASEVGSERLLVNEILPDPAAGEAFFAALGGSYFLVVRTATSAWTVTFTPIRG